MILRGPRKLSHYHYYDHPQLFNLDQDPDEWNDLGQDQAYAPIRKELLAEALKDWSGEAVLNTLKIADQDQKILAEYNQHASLSPKDEVPDHWMPPDGCNVSPKVQAVLVGLAHAAY